MPGMSQGPPGGYNPPPGGYGGPPPGGPPGGYGGPPGGYGGPPPGGYGGPPAPYGGYPQPGPLAPSGAVNLAAFTQREPLTILLLSVVTCGIYGLIWKYQTTEELRQASGDNNINPMLDIVLTVLLCGLWGIYSDYRNAKKVHELARAAGLQRSDQSTIVVVLWLFGLAFASGFILQGEYNALGQAAGGRQLPRLGASARRAQYGRGGGAGRRAALH
jgi:hypothetical protein